MANHVIQLKLTTEQLMHLNTAISESYDCNFDALNSCGFENERSSLSAQCEALQIFMDTIKDKLSGV